MQKSVKCVPKTAAHKTIFTEEVNQNKRSSTCVTISMNVHINAIRKGFVRLASKLKSELINQVYVTTFYIPTAHKLRTLSLAKLKFLKGNKHTKVSTTA